MDIRIVTPFSFKVFNLPQIFCLYSGSNPLVGSSSMINEGLFINALAIISLLLNPPDKSATLEYFLSYKSKKNKISADFFIDSFLCIPKYIEYIKRFS